MISHQVALGELNALSQDSLTISYRDYIGASPCFRVSTPQVKIFC